MNTLVQVFVWTHVSVSLGWVPNGGIAGLEATFTSNFLENHLFFKVAARFQAHLQ